MYCPKCGNILNHEGKFCGNCGATVYSQKGEKKLPLSKCAWFAPLSVVLCMIVELIVGIFIPKILGEFFNFRDYFYDFFENMTEINRVTVATSFELNVYEIITVFFQELIVFPCILVLYSIAFAKVDRKIRSKINLVLLIPYTLHTLSKIIPAAIGEIGEIMVKLEIIELTDLSRNSSVVGISAVILASVISYFWCRSYLKKFEETE